MDFLKLNTERIKCLCLNYEQFVSDCDKLMDIRHDGFGVSPKERFNEKTTMILDELSTNKRTLPSRFFIRLENRHSICNCRIDYVFELVSKDFLKEDIRGIEIEKQTLKFCLDSEVDCIMLYIGMNK